MSVLLIVSLVIYLVLVSFRPHWGIYLILLLLPSYQIRFAFLGIPTTFLEWLILILAGVVAIRLVSKIRPGKSELGSFIFRPEWRKRFSFLAWPIGLAGIFLVASIVAVGSSPQTIKAAGIFKAYILEGILFWALLLYLVDSKAKLFNCFKALGLLVTALSVFGIYQYFTLYRLPPAWWGPGPEPRRVVSLFTYPNAVSLLITPVLALFSGLLVFWEEVRTFVSKRFLILVNVFGVIALLLTFSRGAWLGYAAAVLFLALFSKYKKIIIALLIIAGIGIFAIPTSRDRILPMVTGKDPASIERIKLYQGAWEIIKQQPVFGAGLYGFRDAYSAVRKSDQDEILNYPHNFFLNFWVETGLFGLLAITAMLIWMLVQGVRLLRQNPNLQPLILAVFAAFIVVLVHGQVDAPFFKNDLAILFWFLLGIIPLLKSFQNKILTTLSKT